MRISYIDKKNPYSGLSKESSNVLQALELSLNKETNEIDSERFKSTEAILRRLEKREAQLQSTVESNFFQFWITVFIAAGFGIFSIISVFQNYKNNKNGDPQGSPPK